MPVSVMWFRRDLRLADNPALAAAAAAGDVVGLFVLDPRFERCGAPRRAFLGECLRELDRSMGGNLVVRAGVPAEVVTTVARACGASEVHVTGDVGPYGRSRDRDVAEALRSDGRHLCAEGSPYAVDPGTVEKASGGPYSVFTPFSRAWAQGGWAAPIEAPDVTWAQPERNSGRAVAIPTPRCACELPLAGEAAAWQRWEQFEAGALDDYSTARNDVAADATSRMSFHLRWGTVHPRQLLARLGRSRSHQSFRNELAWREFYADVLFHNPDSFWKNLQPKMDRMPVDRGAAAKARRSAWVAGRTGYPIVDAGMRQLATTGWMHNRVRMITASFLVKDLHLPWQWGAMHFMDHLADGDLASNNHGWQWTAGTGTDAAPYFRVFNPVTQSEKFDPEGTYIRRHVRELAHHDGDVHQPRRGGSGPPSYPGPMVDHAEERADALARYASTVG